MTLRNDQIAIVHGATPSISDLTEITFRNHAHYALKHGYALREFEFRPSEKVWEKIRVLRETFADPNIHRAFWIDADAIFTNLELSLVEHLPNGKIVGACDVFGFNAGCLWLENCPEVRRLLWVLTNQGREMFDSALWKEQSALRYFSLHPPYTELFTYVDPSKMNAYLNEIYAKENRPPLASLNQWKPGCFVLHLPGISHRIRIQILKKILAEQLTPP